MQFKKNYYLTDEVLDILEPRLDCFDCGLDYDHLGKETHPGVCPECGSEAVSPAGKFEVSSSKSDWNFDGRMSLTVFAEDATNRFWKFQFEVDEEFGGGGYIARLTHARIEDATFNADHPQWNSEALSDLAEAVVEDCEEYDEMRLVRADEGAQ